MPKYADVKIRPCPDKPKKEVIYRAILESLGNKDLGFNEDEVQKVDSAWLIIVLGTINPGHRFFNKNYVPTKEERRNQDYLDPKMVDNTDGFFTGLPVNNMERMKAKRRTKFVDVIASERNQTMTPQQLKTMREGIEREAKAGLMAEVRREHAEKVRVQKMMKHKAR